MLYLILQHFVVLQKKRWLNKSLLEIYTKRVLMFSSDYYKSAIANHQLYIKRNKNELLIGNPNILIKSTDEIIHHVHRHEPKIYDFQIKKHIIYEDDNMLVYNKVASMPVHSSGNYKGNSLINILINELDHITKLYPINRLDTVTSGIVLLAKNKEYANKISQQIQQRLVKKEYIARIHGNIYEYKNIKDDTIIINKSIAKISDCINNQSNTFNKTSFKRIIKEDGSGMSSKTIIKIISFDKGNQYIIS